MKFALPKSVSCIINSPWRLESL